MTAVTLLSTKWRIPTARPGLVGRALLVAQLEEGLRCGRRLTLVSAPPGFGKTTLLQEWAGRTNQRVAWLSLEEEDSDPARFLRYVRAALHQGDDGLEPALLDTATSASPQEMVIGLINDLATSGGDRLLVLDDYHLIREFAVHEWVSTLVANQPANLHLAIGTREDPPLPLARLRARDQLTEIRERALRFTREEAAAFLTQTMRLALSPTAIAALTVRTEGWITGLQLAGLALRQQSAADEFVAAFAGDDSYIVDYLMAEVLDRASDAIRDFLRQTSILDRLCAPLCNALTGRDDSQALLEQLEASNLFLVRLDNRREWYRYHVLFAEVLRLILTEQERTELHNKAARWLESHGWSEMAMHHALLATGPPAAGASRSRVPGQPLIEPLSEREIEVLGLVAAGYSNADIARKLHIAGGTVKRHLNNIFGKLGVGSRTQAIARARALGLLE